MNNSLQAQLDRQRKEAENAMAKEEMDSRMDKPLAIKTTPGFTPANVRPRASADDSGDKETELRGADAQEEPKQSPLRVLSVAPIGVKQPTKARSAPAAVNKPDDEASGVKQRGDDKTQFKPANSDLLKDRQDVQGDSSQQINLGETPAEAPPRDLPEGLDAQQLQFIEGLDSIYTLFNDTDLLGQAIRAIMVDLQSNHQYMELIADSDIAMLIRASRERFGMAKIEKAGKKRSASPKKKAGKLEAMGSLLDDLLVTTK